MTALLFNREMGHNKSGPVATFALPLVVCRPIFFCGLLVAATLGFAGQQQKPFHPKPADTKGLTLAAPALSMGTSRPYQEAVVRLESALEAGKFAEASNRLADVPKREVRIYWNVTDLPESLQESFAESRDQVIRDWSTGLAIKLTVVDKPEEADLTVSFAPTLNAPANATTLPGIATFFSAPNTHWKVEAVIGLKRGAPVRGTTEIDVYNDFAYAIGQYFGLADTVMPVGVMYRPDNGRPVKANVVPAERVLADHNLQLVEALHQDVLANQKLAAGMAKAVVDPLKVTIVQPKVQGALEEFSIQITNMGSAPMETRLIPGCACFVSADPITIPPGKTSFYPVQMKTFEYSTDVEKHLYLMTSDPDHPTFDIPVSVAITPRYRFIAPPANTILVGDKGADYILYMFEEGEELFVEDARLAGLRGKVTFDQWSGVMADPGRNEPARKRTGYKFHIHLEPGIPPGRFFLSLNIQTSDSQFRNITAQYFAQRGIVAVPDNLYMGHIAAVERQTEVQLTRPGKSFHILGVTSNDSHVAVTAPDASATTGLHRLVVKFDGHVPIGDYSATITVKTDDKTQPTITIPVSATIQ